MKALCHKESHLNIIHLLDHGVLVDKSVYFIDMELCDISLEQYMNGTSAIMGFHRLQDWKKLEPNIFLITAIMQQLLSGLAFIHKSGKVHRDLNPKNGRLHPLLC